jgi:phytoene dehydrogenase-like protein
MLGIRGELPQLPHHTLLFTRDWAENFGALAAGRVPSPASAYVCRPSATDPDVAPAGHENLFLLVPSPADPALGRGGQDGAGSPAVEAIADEAIAQLAAWSGASDLAERVVVRRTVGPGDFHDDLHAWRGRARRTPWTRPPSSVPGPSPAASTPSTTPAPRPSRGSACRCA